jgi:hypothetical protein
MEHFWFLELLGVFGDFGFGFFTLEDESEDLIRLAFVPFKLNSMDIDP